ncbi:MAG: hypothetical protein ACHQ6T_12000 [Myxococcota bacterium]
MGTGTRRSPRTPRAKGTAPKLLTWGKTKRALGELGIDEHKFIKAYESLASTRSPRQLDAVLLAAGERFARDGDFGAFKRAIKSNNDQQANARLGRYFKYKTRRERR